MNSRFGSKGFKSKGYDSQFRVEVLRVWGHELRVNTIQLWV
jgi:hypothetical protein